MSEEIFIVKNVKCGGCASAIQDGIKDQSGVTTVEVEVASGQVTVSGEGLDRAALSGKLAALGYPEA
ncbi:MAG: heavy-metal-associated domain-containing protein [Chromatiales bacterium]|nr:cation transporter [Gammaproteobacteria bacterium]MBW6476219.1 heavy-metal-associated domain-containing protein [Chromatiales bacterium]